MFREQHVVQQVLEHVVLDANYKHAVWRRRHTPRKQTYDKIKGDMVTDTLLRYETVKRVKG